ncbi:MAG: GNAT family N-acetyltransferase [Polyangiaceae bacterium]|nr:GNAT family N-acetyltransferase [Myxococcales bacterium]MCB9589727.1 GNAT family N-acetyltransferase [Polyangiaceae bacterium]
MNSNLTDIVFETQRLIARPWRLEDAAAGLSLYSDPEVVRFIGMEPILGMDGMLDMLRRIQQRNEMFPRGMGGFATFERETGELVGNLLLKPLPGVSGSLTFDIEIGWHLRRSHWGRGFASEGGRGLLRYGFETLGLDRLHAVVEPPNERSLNVARAIGLIHDGRTQRYYSGIELEHFQVDKADWTTGSLTAGAPR